MHSIINSKIQTLISSARENLTAFYILYKNIAISLIKKKLNYGAKKWKKKNRNMSNSYLIKNIMLFLGKIKP